MTHRLARFLVLSVALLLVCPSLPSPFTPMPAAAQELVLPRLAEPVHIDGRPDESVWQDVPPLPMTMFEPESGGNISRSSIVRMAHDGRYLYASGIFVDEGPVRANSLVRDEYADDDYFNLVIDSFDDGETALWFLVTPLGTRQDGAITNDAEGDAWNHPEFNNVWDAAAEITDTGWTAEMRIPFTSLRFAPVGDTVRLGLIAGRMITRIGERHTYPAIARGPNAAHFKPSLAGNVVLAEVESTHLVRATPYVISRREWTGSASVDQSDGTGHDVGGDLKLGLGSRFTLDVTLNTDFAQTEADDERINLGRFDLFFPEKRQFFLERAGAFAFGDRADHRLFHSRTIGLDDTGVPEPIFGGARLTGRASGWEVGALQMFSDASSGGTEMTGVLRGRRDLEGVGSYVGAMATARRPGIGPRDGAAGLDGALRLRGTHFFTFSAAASQIEGGDGGPAVELALRDRDRRGLTYDVAAGWRHRSYDPPLGFVERVGISFVEGSLTHGAFNNTGRLQERMVGIRGALVTRDAFGAVETARGTVHWDGRRRGGGAGSAGVTVVHEALDESFMLAPDVTVPRGDHTFVEATMSVDAPSGWRVRGWAEVSGGEYFDGHRLSVGLHPLVTFSRHLEIAGSVERNHVRFAARGERFRGDIVRLGVRASLDARLSLHALGQYNSATDRLAGNVRVRYAFAEGRDLYLVWNEGHRTSERSAQEERGLDFRGLAIKYTHPIG
jgi:hypothetical protein